MERIRYKESKEDVEGRAKRLVAETREFISANPGIFYANLADTDPIILYARNLRQLLNNLGNKLLAIGGAVSPIFGEISDLISKLDIIMDKRGFYVENNILWTNEQSCVHKVSKKINLRIHTVLAAEIRICYGKLHVGDNGNNHEPSMDLERVRKNYHALLLRFSLNVKSGFESQSHWAKINKYGGDIGWMAVNLKRDTLHNSTGGLDSGHAFGRIWDIEQVKLIARGAVTQTDAHDLLSYTLISNTNNAYGFEPDPLQLKSNSQLDMEEIIRLVASGIRIDSCSQSEFVVGGREGLVPLEGIRW